MFNANRNMKNINDETVLEAKDKAREAGKNVYNFFKRNSAKIKDTSQNAANTIRSNPLKSAAAIFAAGLVIGSLLKKSRKQ